MTREEKTAVIEELKEKFANSEFFYVTDSSTLSVEQVTTLRGMLFEKGIEMRVVKNTLARKALEAADASKGYGDIIKSLVGPTALLFSESANAPAKVIKEFRKSAKKPVLKAAYIDSAVYSGDDQIATLSTLKSKDELLGELIGLLQSPARNLVGALQSGQHTLMGLLKALEERG